MLKLICVNENGVAYVETDCGEVFGIVNAFCVTDGEGKKEEGDVCSVLDGYTDIDQGWDSESNVISFREENGESYKLYVTADGVELIDDNE